MFKKTTFNDFSYQDNQTHFLIILMGIPILVFMVSLSGSYATNVNTVGSNVSLNSSHYKITIFDHTVGGNVVANPRISQNIPKTDLSNQIFQMTKNGSVLLKFGNGNGPKLLMSVGIHGNEIQANIAAMKYLEFIKDKQFNGTLYIIPFDIPCDTALNTRYYKGMDPNRIANIPDTPSWKIVQFAKNNGINYLLDVHSGGGVGSNRFIYVNHYFSNREKNWVSYITYKTLSSTGYDSADSAGMIRVSSHNYGINSITLETERDNTPVMTAANAEFKMILAAAQYLGFPGTNYHPKVISTYPKVNAIRISLTAPVNIKFNENIKSSIYYSSIKLKNLITGKYVTITRTISDHTLYLKTSTTRSKYTWYQVTIPKAAIKDYADNNLLANYTFKFKTGSI
jgi:predicted deacylase